MSTFSHRRAAVELQFFDPSRACVAQWQRLHDYRHQRAAEDALDEPVVGNAEFETELKTERPLYQRQRLLALRDGAILGNLVLSYRRPGSPGSNDYAAHLDVGGGVLAAQRRQGVGSTLAAGLVDFMAQRQKTMATFYVNLSAGERFMDAIGARCKLRNVRNRLLLQRVDWAAMQRWATLPESCIAGLRWEVHAGRVPMDVLAGLMAPLSALINQIPLGTLEQPPIRYQLEGYDTWYADMDRRGGEHLMVLLRAGDEIAAVCDASWDQRFPDRMHQALTAVALPWRGRGLAKAVKARMLLLARQRLPSLTMVNTLNAQSNEPMLAINRQLGFAVHQQDLLYQIERDALSAHLAARALAQ